MLAQSSAQAQMLDWGQSEADRGAGFDQADRRVHYLDSGWVENTVPGSGLDLVWSGVQHQPGAMWMRLHFSTGVLSGEYGDAEATRIVLTGLEDGAVQVLDSLDLLEWSMGSAYFNGDAVRVQIFAAPGMGASRVCVGSVEYGNPGFLDRSICGTTDDRVLGSDPASARMLPVNCTGWLVNDRAYGLLSAGHCDPTPGTVVQFNVPQSTIGGSMRHPPPEDQYAVDLSSVQTQAGSISVGNDWAFFGVFENPNTGLSPLAAQGMSYRASPTLPTADGRSVRVGGYGSVIMPMPLTYNFVYTTHVGEYVGNTGNTVRYTADTTGGNSGSAVIDEMTGLAIAIHTNGGCNSSGGNKGTATKNAGLQAALASPLGMAAARDGSHIAFPNQRPAEVRRDGGTVLRAKFGPSHTRSPVIETAHLHVWDEGTWVSVPMTPTSGGAALVSFPSLQSCDGSVRYYVSVQNELGETDVSPIGAPGATYQARVADSGRVLFASDMASSDGWTYLQSPGLISGRWKSALVHTLGRMAPEMDFDATGRCAVTGVQDGVDVDGGPSIMISPEINLSGADDPVLSFAAWYADTNPTPGVLAVEYSTDLDPAWRTLDQIGRTDGWEMRVYRLAAILGSAESVRVRFVASDEPNAAIVEAGVDRFRVEDMRCSRCTGDLNADGAVDASDLEQMLRLLGGDDVEADLNNDGSIDAADLLLLGSTMGSACP
ncbi:MAG: hypothetical protein DYG94_01165 [Leptolyngbya sp. PLA3]|nr:MAG: hypothetical protein EDM82_00710 [Cyanobacteria bacterium CYA]MCE7967340.1 hypothetical protein [Leptolyngbya sp. PL-A3]